MAFAFSGMSALIYEITWSRALQAILGSTIYAVSVILAGFMTGFALGSYLFRGIAEKSSNPKLLFASLQFSLGVYGLLIIGIFGLISLSNTYLDGFSRQLLFIPSFAAITIPAILFGATWPVAARCFIRGTNRLGEDSGLLYSFNSMGSFLGPIAAAFLLLPLLGIFWTITFTAAINITLAAILFSASKRRSVR